MALSARMRNISLLLLAAFLIPSSAFAHPGSTDSSDGHYCWTNCEQYGLQTGEYHFHDTNGDTVAAYDNNAGIYDEVLAERLHGQILLQVEEHGEAWYVRSSDSKRYYMQDGGTAYQMMRYFSIGITDADLATIPFVADTTEMNSSTSACSSNALAERLAGEILLQVEQHGEAWYVDPAKCRAIYMADGSAAYEIMRYLGLGILNGDLEKVVVGVTDESTAADTSETTETSEESSTEETVSYSFSGNGSGITATFELQEGLALFATTHSGESNFITHLLDSEGETVEYLTNEIGDYSGVSVGRADDDGTYLLNVDADGAWTIEITQPRPTTGDTVPYTATGSSDDVVGPIYLSSGLHTLEMSHEGDWNFIVHLVDLDGNTVEYIANEIGQVDFTQAIGVDEAGVYYLSVVGDTSWSVSIR